MSATATTQERPTTGASDETRAVLLVLCSMTSIQLGAAIAKGAFDDAGPVGAVWVRSVIGGGLLAIYLRPRVRSFTRDQMTAIVPLALALTALVVSYYLALDRAPLGVVSSIAMLGPLTVAVTGRRGRLDFAWIAFAAAGVLVLASADGVDGRISALGIVWSLAAASGWGLYILAGKKVNERVEGLNGLAAALVIAAALQTPLGLALAKDHLWTGSSLAACAAAGVLATLIPFTFEMTALRTLSTGAFGLLMALEPAIAAIIGLGVRGQDLTGTQIAGIGLVVIASAGVMGPSRLRGRRYARAVIDGDLRLESLARVSLFEDLSEDELRSIAERMQPREVPSGTELTTEGEAGAEFLVVDEGALEVSVRGRIVNTMHRGDFLGEIALLFGGTRTATAVTTEPSRLFVMERDDFASLLAEHSRIEGKLMAVVAQRMRYR